MVRGASGSGGHPRLRAGASTESLGLVRRLVDRLEVTAAIQVPLGDEAPLAGIPNLALRRERAPNLAGAELLGYGTALGGRHAGQVPERRPRGRARRRPQPADEAALAAAAGVVVVLRHRRSRRGSATPSWCCR